MVVWLRFEANQFVSTWITQIKGDSQCLTTVGKENSGNIDIYYKNWGAGQPVVLTDLLSFMKD
jgi:hypothetical protein